MIGDEGACAVAEALKSNATLVTLLYVSFPPFFSLSCWLSAAHAHSFPPRERVHSLGINNIGPEGARAVAEALKTNATLTTL